MSKGSVSRPFSVTQYEYDNRWDAIFGKDKPEVEAACSSCGSCKNSNCHNAVAAKSEISHNVIHITNK